MGAITDYVSLTISQNSVGLTRASFGIPMLLSHGAVFPERLRYYNDLAGVLVDFPVTTSPEYLAAAAMFSQSPAPSKIAIGRGANKPTMIAQLSAVSPTANINHVYKATVRGKGFATQVITFTADATPTDAEYAAGMVIALNAVVGKNFTAAGATSPITITGTTAGDWFSVEVDNVGTQKIKYTHADPGVAADLAAITLEQPNWYMLFTLYNSKAYAQAASVWIEANSREYISESCDTESITAAAGNADWLDTIATSAYARTAGAYHPNPAAMFAAAWGGKFLTYDPGSVSPANRPLTGVAPVNLNATHRANLVSRRASSYETVAGLNITFGGSVGDPVTGYLDNRRDLDYAADDMQKTVLEALVANPKLPMTAQGIAMIESQMRGSLKRMVAAGVFADGPTVTVPKVADISNADKTARRLLNMKFGAVQTGAIQTVGVNGNVSLSLPAA